MEPEMCAPRRETPGITLFDDAQAWKGCALNKMFMSFNDAANRAEFLRDEDAYCARYGLNEHQRDAIRRRDMLALVAAGGNAYYLAKFGGVLAAGG
jgi:protocatechuate 4,5-dioxygenase, alpha chain